MLQGNFLHANPHDPEGVVSSILQPWVTQTGLRHQGVLMSAMRGCDTAPRHDPSKLVQRLLRGAVLESHCGRAAKSVSYIVVEPDVTVWWKAVNAFVRSWDHYPNHYVIHFIHAVEIIGFYGPKESPVFCNRWRILYCKAVYLLHFNPETKEQLDNRLNADEAEFTRLQQER